MKTIENHLSIHANALNLRGKRNKILASNIANAATPHFKARDIDFNAIDVDYGSGIYSVGNTFDDVGNNNSGDGTNGAVADVINYSVSNVSNCTSM